MAKILQRRSVFFGPQVGEGECMADRVNWQQLHSGITDCEFACPVMKFCPILARFDLNH